MNNFKLKARLKSEKESYDAQWLQDFYGPGRYGVKFLNGPNAGHVFSTAECVGTMGAKQSNKRRKK